MDNDEYKFKIDAYSPETIPMARLAEYMHELAKLLANQDRVHFKGVEAGSTVLVARVEHEAIPKVANRVDAIHRGEPDDDAREAFKVLNEMLRNDNATGELQKEGNVIFLKFPGREIPRPERIGPITQHTSIDGELVRIGGKDQTAHALIQDAEGRIWSGSLSRELARELSKHLYEGPVLRVEGDAKWERDEDGNWDARNLRIQTFKVLPEDTLIKVVNRLRKIEGSEWKNMNDPIGFIHNLRRDDDEVH